MSERSNILDKIVQGHSHKDMGGTLVPSGELQTAMAERGLSTKFDIASGDGGFIWNGHYPVSYLRSSFWRAQEGDTDIHASDIRPLFIVSKEGIGLNTTGTGGELEIFVWDQKAGEMAPVLGEGSPIPDWLLAHGNGNGFEPENPLFASLEEDARKIGFSAELLNGCIELNFHHSDEAVQVSLAMLRSLKKLDAAVNEQGWQVAPVSFFMHREAEPEDTNMDPYVQRIAMKYMKWENVRHFLGASWQVHVEMLDLESGLKALNEYQLVSPLTSAISLASPFGYGEINPNLKDIFLSDETSPARAGDTETLRALDSNDWLSFRYPGRWRGSPSGGVFEKPAPETLPEFFSQAEKMLMDNSPDSTENIPSPARTMGHHRDRIRPDIGPHGTLEISNMDTFGGDPLKLAANQEFTRVLAWKLQYFARTGQMAEVAKAYPELFCATVDSDGLRTAHINSIEVSKRGVDATVVGANGLPYRAGDLFVWLTDFVNDPITDESNNIDFKGLPKGVTDEMLAAASVPTESHYEKFRDENGITSAEGFYKSREIGRAHV